MLPRDHFLLLGHLKSPYILRRLIFVQNLNILYLTLDITEGVARLLLPGMAGWETLCSSTLPLPTFGRGQVGDFKNI